MTIPFIGLPSLVIGMFHGPESSWPNAVRIAQQFGYTDANQLTDLVFNMRHPERKGKSLSAKDSKLIKEWKKINQAIAGIMSKSPANLPPNGTGPRWLQYAQQELTAWSGVYEGSVSKDEEYFMAAPYWGGKSHPKGKVPSTGLAWCAAFVNWCLHRAGYSHTGSGGDDSFKNRGSWHFDALREPKRGCVIVLGNTQYQNNSNHVSFLWDWTSLPKGNSDIGDVWTSDFKASVRLLGGNQSNRVMIKGYSGKLFAARGQNGVTSPYLWPKRGPAECTIDTVPSEHGHACRHQPT